MFSGSVIRIGRKSGWLHCALYLKQCASSLHKAYGGVKDHHDLLPVPVSLTRSPRIIPSFHRQLLRDERADVLVQIYLSFFTLSKALAKKVTRSTFDSIIRPWDDPESVLSQVGEIKLNLKSLLERYVPWVSTRPLYQGLEWSPTWKSVPSNSPANSVSLESPTQAAGS